MATTGKKTACVIGGTGFLGSFLIKLLLDKGYAVNAAVRDPSTYLSSLSFYKHFVFF